jgi:cardiolipin synthase A/B
MRIFKIVLLFLFVSLPHLTFASEQLIIEPDAGRAPILAAINNAKSSVDLVMYGLTDETLINALLAAKESGKKVQVLLEPHPYKADDENNVAISHLNSAKINLYTPNPDFKLTHQKTFIIDNKKALVMTFNLTHSSFKNERNFALIIDDPAMVQEISRVFIADSQHKNIEVTQPNLLWSPNNSREKMLDFINAATSEIDIYAQGLSDYKIIGALAKAAKSGKKVKILLAANTNETHSKKFDYLRNASVMVHFCKHYIIHAKVIITDHNQAVLGSINFTKPSLNNNRELSVVTSNPQTIAALENTFNQDWQGPGMFEQMTSKSQTHRTTYSQDAVVRHAIRLTTKLIKQLSK